MTIAVPVRVRVVSSAFLPLAQAIHNRAVLYSNENRYIPECVSGAPPKGIATSVLEDTGIKEESDRHGCLAQHKQDRKNRQAYQKIIHCHPTLHFIIFYKRKEPVTYYPNSTFVKGKLGGVSYQFTGVSRSRLAFILVPFDCRVLLPKMFKGCASLEQSARFHLRGSEPLQLLLSARK